MHLSVLKFFAIIYSLVSVINGITVMGLRLFALALPQLRLLGALCYLRTSDFIGF